MATRSAASNQEIQKIIKEIHQYQRTTDKEMKELRMKIIKLQKMIEKNILQKERPNAHKRKVVRNFEIKKKKGKIEFYTL